MSTFLSLAPLFSYSTGVNKIDDLFENLLKSERKSNNLNSPAYNIEKQGEQKYTITVAVPGFQDKDLTITAQDNKLTIVGKKNEKEEEGKEYIHCGIMTSFFEQSFQLPDHMKILDARMKDGLLHIDLEQEIPESAKPRMITINNVSNEASSKMITNKMKRKEN